MGFGARKHLLHQGLRHSIKGSIKTEKEIANTNNISTGSTDLKIKQIYEIINKQQQRNTRQQN